MLHPSSADYLQRIDAGTDRPRFSLIWLNVAISSAQRVCFVARSPHLAVMEPTSPDGMVMLGKFVTLCNGRESVSIGQ